MAGAEPRSSVGYATRAACYAVVLRGRIERHKLLALTTERHMKNKLIGLLCLFIASCATQYQPYSYFGGGGYREVKLAENVFKVTVEANGYTSSSKATDLALLRSADLAIEHGFKYFVIGATSDDSYSSSYTTPTTANVNFTSYGNTVNGTAQTYGGQTYNFHFPTPSITITCFKEKPTFQTTIYDAETVSKSLRARLGVK